MTDTVKATLQAVVTCAVVTGLVFGSAGTLSWWNGWLFVVAYCSLIVVTTGFFSKSPELVKERWTAGKKAKTWDRGLVVLMAVVLPLLNVLLAGLDHRLGWTGEMPVAVVVASFFLMLISSGLMFWAVRVNPFFSSHVRIQSDRGQKVVSDGPYRYVRHPGYTGAITFNLAAPVVLGSLVAVWVGMAMLLVIVLRTVLEDKMLQSELPGYKEYAAGVRYRLIPFLW
jgi:protein-S-isoprenylcysteine O-methyltransferase Ste14